jgi:hypothetical protein
LSDRTAEENAEKHLNRKEKIMALPYFKNHDVTLRFDECGRQNLHSTKRIYGLVKLKQIATLIEVLDLESNPRDSKVSSITNDIIETLETTPELYPLKSKGILLAATKYSEKDRDRFELDFVERSIEGVLDGGHNLLAIGHFLMQQVLEDPKDLRDLRAAKIWTDFKSLFKKHIDLVHEFLSGDDSTLQILVPVELLLPLSDSELDKNNFERILIDIQEARNNNAQLKLETKADKAGLFDDLKSYVDSSIRQRIEWRSNEPGDVKVADLVALAWIPLTALEMTPFDEDKKPINAPSPVQTYSQKSVCVTRYNDFMSSPGVTTSPRGKAELTNVQVLSALKIAGADMPKLYDLIAKKFPEAYNANNGRFGGITAVEKLNSGAKSKLTKFTNETMTYKSPEGFLAPLVYSLKALLVKGVDGNISWRVDPYKFVNNYINDMVKPYSEVMKEAEFDPQKVGKSSAAFNSCLSTTENIMLRMLTR